MMTYQVTIKGLAKLQLALVVAPEKTVEQIGLAVQKSLVLIRSAALREAPVNKQPGGGNLRQMIGTKMITKTSGAVISKAKYSLYVHEGTRPHEIRVVNKKVLANKRTGQVFGKVVHHPGTRPNPFFTRAITATKIQVVELFKQAIIKALSIFK